MIRLHWFLPTSGDSREIVGFGETAHRRDADIDYLALVARTAERLGFSGVLTPTGTWCEDAWITTAALIGETTTLKFLVAFRPGLISPTLAAQMASTYQRVSKGRLMLNVVTGGDIAEQRRFGDWLDHDERYQRTGEFLEILRGAWSGTPLDFEGLHYRTEGSTVMKTPDPVPEIFFGGASTAAEAVAAQHVDVYLAWGEPPAMVAERVERVRAQAAQHGRTVRFGIRLHVISRDTPEAAWAETDRLLAGITDRGVRAAQQLYSTTQSVGQQRMAALHNGDRTKLEIAPNLWAGYGLVRGGAGTALVGSHEQVAERILEYHGLGFDEFILSGQPHIEEAYWFAEGVRPLLKVHLGDAFTPEPPPALVRPGAR